MTERAVVWFYTGDRNCSFAFGDNDDDDGSFLVGYDGCKALRRTSAMCFFYGVPDRPVSSMASISLPHALWVSAHV